MFKKFLQTITGGVDQGKDSEEDPSLVATPEEFDEFAKSPLDQGITENYLNIFLRNYRFYVKNLRQNLFCSNFKRN